MYGSLIKKHKLFCSEISLPWNGHSKAKSQGHELWSETRREVRRALQGRGRIAVPRAPSVDEECMRRPARPGVPIGPRTGPEALPILWGVRSEETIWFWGVRGHCAQRRRTGADTHSVQLWTSRTATAARTGPRWVPSSTSGRTCRSSSCSPSTTPLRRYCPPCRPFPNMPRFHVSLSCGGARSAHRPAPPPHYPYIFLLALQGTSQGLTSRACWHHYRMWKGCRV